MKRTQFFGHVIFARAAQPRFMSDCGVVIMRRRQRLSPFEETGQSVASSNTRVLMGFFVKRVQAHICSFKNVFSSSDGCSTFEPERETGSSSSHVGLQSIRVVGKVQAVSRSELANQSGIFPGLKCFFVHKHCGYTGYSVHISLYVISSLT